MPALDNAITPISRRFLHRTFFAATLIALSASANGTTATLRWNPISQVNIAGYRIYYGTSSHSYPNQIDAGFSATTTIPNLAIGETYFFAATSYNNLGIESVLSAEIAYTAIQDPSPTPPSTDQPSLLNISTRLFVQPDSNAMIGGFIISGDLPKKVLLRGLGPSLAASGISNPMHDPVLRLFDSSGTLIASNDNWRSDQAQLIQNAGLAPSDDRESALISILLPGSYTTLVSDVNNTSGVALFEFYDLDTPVSRLTNLSTRGSVLTADRVLIGGFVTAGSRSASVVLRAIGPSLASSGIPDPLLDPSVELYNAEGSLLASNDNWRSDQEQLMINLHLAPGDNRESAIFATLSPGQYSTVVRGVNDSTGTALVEIYRVDP